MNAPLLFLGLDVALLASAAVLLVVVIWRGRLQYLALAVLLIALAIGVWFTAIRNPAIP